MKKFLRRSAIGLAGLLTLVALGYAIENWRGAKAWADEQARIRTRGEPLVWSDLLGPAPAPGDNFAESPLFEGLFDYARTRDDQGRERNQWKGQAATERLGNTFKVPDPLKSETRSQPAPGLDLELVASRFRADPKWEGPADSGNPARDILAFLESRREPLAQLSEALQRPVARFPIRYEDGPLALLPQLALMKGAATLLQIRAVARLATRDPAGAARDVEDQLRLARATGDDPILIGALVRFALANIATTTFWQGWRDGAWTGAELARLQEAFANQDVKEGFADALRGERIFSSAIYDILRTDPARYHQILSDGGDGEAGPSTLTLIPSGWIRQNQAVQSRLIDGMVRRLQETPAGRSFTTDVTPMARELQSLPTVYAIFPRMLLPPLENALKKAERAQVTPLLAATVCALERHRIEKGSYPETLESLVPALLKAVPIDPFDGKPLRYAREGVTGFRLYSIGPDRKDDGGETEGEKAPDWAWPGREATSLQGQF